MPLPQISVPTYELEIPSTNKKIKYRPFLVKEEKVLIMAMESEDQKEISRAIKNVIHDCILTRGVKVDTLSTFDIEYLFLNIRAKSVGETVEVNVTCPDDGETQVGVEIAIDDIRVQKDPNHSNVIKLDDNISVMMKYPSLDQFVENNFEVDNGTSDVDKSMNVIINCIDQIFTEEESWSASDSTKKELKDFVDQMNTKQFKDIENFFNTMPKLSHTITVTNPKTKVKNNIVLEGLASFFS